MKTYVKVLLILLAIFLVVLENFGFQRVKRETVSRIKWISATLSPKLYNQTPAEYYYKVSCNQIASERNSTELDNLEQIVRETSDDEKDWIRQVMPDSVLTEKTERECSAFIDERGYITSPLSAEEENYPIAYSIVAYEKAGEVERLLRSIYRPQNVYCIHADKKSEKSFYEALEGLASCFPNVILASKRETVVYAHYSRLQADFNCMEDLLNFPVNWKYHINLCGTDFPLKTNAEIVRYLQFIEPSNEIESWPMSKMKKDRIAFAHNLVDGRKLYISKQKGDAKSPPPHEVPEFAGSAYNILSRAFVDYVMTDEKIQDLKEWSKDVFSPDEFFWAALGRFPLAPGSIPPTGIFNKNEFQSLARLTKWQTHVKNGQYPRCHGEYRHDVCVYGAGDLSWLLEQKHLFANKFSAWTDELALQCLEKILREREIKNSQDV